MALSVVTTPQNPSTGPSGSLGIQGSSPSLQGSSPNLQSASSGLTIQPASSGVSLQSAQNVINQGQSTLNSSNALIAQGNQESTQIASLLKSIQAEEQANVPGVAPSLNLNAINAQAQAAAGNTVNPLYTQYMNEYNQQLATQSGTSDLGALGTASTAALNNQATGLNGTAEQQNTMNLQQEQASLANTQAQNQLAQNAAASSNTLSQGNINAQSQNYELNSAQAQNQKIASITQSIGSGNLGASGMGQQQLWQASLSKNIADAQQQGQYQYQRDTGNLSTADTFAQLAQSSAYAATAEGQEEKQTNFNLGEYLLQAAASDQSYQQASAASQQQALTATTQQNEATAVQNQLSSLNPTGSKNYAAGETAYSNVLNPSTSLPTAPSASDYLTAVGSSV